MTAYATYIEADTYFQNRLHVLTWNESSTSDKTIALTEATARIDRLRFSGALVDDDQELEFPRYYGDEADGTEEIPEDIEIATCELAFTLLDGVEPDLEFENLGVTSHKYSTVQMNNNPNVNFDHIAAGIPSATAWRYLMPYLADAKGIQLNRVS